MRRFLAVFWKIRDRDPSTALNEFKQTYFENIALADTRFSTSIKLGWRTDRGRVLLLYGRPDEIERNPSSIDTKPYETWFYYSLDGGVQFIFGDVSGFGEYELMHSTHRNEIHDPNWRARIGPSRDIIDY
jgi:GWxTD domain-containing protein